jgi:flagellar basal-body rod protein FlgF
METSSYVALSGQLALEKRMETIAQNIANAATPGYRANGVQFSTVTSRTAPHETAFASTGANFASMAAGGMTKTDGPLDLAVQGNGFFAFEGAQGTFYARDGRLTVAPDGLLTSLNAQPVLDSGGGQIIVNPADGPVTIARNGTVMQGGVPRGIIGLFQIDLSAGFARVENSGLVPVAAAEPVTSFTNDGIVQGYIEGSNVNPVNEMVRLIQVSRAFEAISNMSERAHDAEKSALQALASR